MFQQAVISTLNLMLRANSQQALQLIQLQQQAIELSLPFITVKFIITEQGLLKTAEDRKVACSIEVPLTVLGYSNNLQQLQALNIRGDMALAQQFLRIISTVEACNLLYAHLPEQFALVAYPIEVALQQLISYLQLIKDNGVLSLQEYLQAETKILALPVQLEEFYQAVDELRERSDLLQARIKRIEAGQPNSNSGVPLLI